LKDNLAASNRFTEVVVATVIKGEIIELVNERKPGFRYRKN